MKTKLVLALIVTALSTSAYAAELKYNCSSSDDDFGVWSQKDGNWISGCSFKGIMLDLSISDNLATLKASSKTSCIEPLRFEKNENYNPRAGYNKDRNQYVLIQQSDVDHELLVNKNITDSPKTTSVSFRQRSNDGGLATMVLKCELAE